MYSHFLTCASPDVDSFLIEAPVLRPFLRGHSPEDLMMVFICRVRPDARPSPQSTQCDCCCELLSSTPAGGPVKCRVISCRKFTVLSKEQAYYIGVMVAGPFKGRTRFTSITPSRDLCGVTPTGEASVHREVCGVLQTFSRDSFHAASVSPANCQVDMDAGGVYPSAASRSVSAMSRSSKFS